MSSLNQPAVSFPPGLEAERLLRKILDESRDAIVVGDVGGQIKLLNRAAEELFGRPAEGIVGTSSFEDLCPPGVWPSLRRQFFSERFGGPGRLSPAQAEILSGSGDRIPVDISAAAIGPAEKPDWILLFLRDVRLQVKLGERLAHAQTQLEQGARPVLLAELAGTAAHELNQPLTSIIGYGDLLRRHLADGSSDAATLDVIIREAERMAEIVRKMGRVNRYETKSYIGESRIVDLDKAADRKEPGGG